MASQEEDDINMSPSQAEGYSSATDGEDLFADHDTNNIASGRTVKQEQESSALPQGIVAHYDFLEPPLVPNNLTMAIPPSRECDSPEAAEMAGDDGDGHDEEPDSGEILDGGQDVRQIGVTDEDVVFEVKGKNGVVRTVHLAKLGFDGKKKEFKTKMPIELRREANVIKNVIEDSGFEQNSRNQEQRKAQIALRAKANYKFDRGTEGEDYGQSADADDPEAYGAFIECKRGAFNMLEKKGKVKFVLAQEDPEEDVECDCEICVKQAAFKASLPEAFKSL